MLEKSPFPFPHNVVKMPRIRHIHFAGIGGVGMCGIAEILQQEGYLITGSDLERSPSIKRLEDLGIKVYLGHHSENLVGADVLVCSTAIKETNIERLTAKQMRIPIVPRAQMLAELMRFRYGIAVAGTHGKTTTTSLIASIFAYANQDPTFVIGGRLLSVDTHARLGKGHYLIAEADESDASFLHLSPMVSVITNIDSEHMQTYDDSIDTLNETFESFLQRMPFYGLSILCADDLHLRKMSESVSRPTRTYGFYEKSDYRIVDFEQHGIESTFTVKRPTGCDLNIRLSIPGRHNALNCTAAIAVASEEGLPSGAIVDALLRFKGVARRFEILGQTRIQNKRVMVIDDYGHHPTEILATLKTLQQVWPSRRCIHIYQPHRFTRTKQLFEEFVQVLQSAPVLFLTPVYAAGESSISGADSNALLTAIRSKGHPNAYLLASPESLFEMIKKSIRDDDILLFQGAGSISKLAKQFMMPTQEYESAW